MSLLKAAKKDKPLRASGGGAAGEVSSQRPQFTLKAATCSIKCPSGTDIRGWIALVAQREKLSLTEEGALEQAWRKIVEVNPFPAVMGRVCPHPCEDDCNRVVKDGAVSINAMERFVGDFALEKGLKLDKIEGEKPESVGVIGAGPAGLSFAYQMARRGYKVTVYESRPAAGGMLVYGIPECRLPRDVMDREIQRILDLGVDLNLNCAAGRDVTMDELRKRHQVLFLGIGAHKGKAMRIPGEEGPGVWTGTEYLRRVNSHERVDVGNAVAVIGGGDTAVDAARVARRTGAQVTIVYRRTRTEMPAIAPEIEAALKEGVRLELLLAPVEVKRDASGGVVALRVQKMELGEPDESGRRRPVPVKGSEYDIPVDTVIAAISQEPDWAPLNDVKPKSGWVEVDAHGKWTDGVYSGGDVLDLGIATTAVAHGRRAAEAAHAQLRGLEPPRKSELPAISRDRLKPEIYEAKARSERAHRPVEEWLTRPDDEIDLGLTREQFLFEAGRCFSCGQCSACERCWMYCTPNCFSKLPEPRPGAYFSVRLDICDGCKKCAEQCPCGFLDMV